VLDPFGPRLRTEKRCVRKYLATVTAALNETTLLIWHWFKNHVLQQKAWGYSLQYQHYTRMTQNDNIAWMKPTFSASRLHSEGLNTTYTLQSEVTVVYWDMLYSETGCDITLQLLLLRDLHELRSQNPTWPRNREHSHVIASNSSTFPETWRFHLMCIFCIVLK